MPTNFSKAELPALKPLPTHFNPYVTLCNIDSNSFFQQFKQYLSVTCWDHGRILGRRNSWKSWDYVGISPFAASAAFGEVAVSCLVAGVIFGEVVTMLECAFHGQFLSLSYIGFVPPESSAPGSPRNHWSNPFGIQVVACMWELQFLLIFQVRNASKDHLHKFQCAIGV